MEKKKNVNPLIQIRRCLVIVPHQDDETILAGGTILKLLSHNVEVYVLYSTNGDYKYKAEIRITEAISALRVLGVPKDNIILLGYSDTYNNPSHSHLFYSEIYPVMYKNGKNTTYGVYDKDEFAYKNKGVHNSYCWCHFKEDLQAAIEFFSADLIICVDFDEHPDHRALSLAFDEAMKNILQKTQDYKPIVLKGFAYSTAYTAREDLFEEGIGFTERPQVGITDKYNFDMIDSFIYQWDKRIQIPLELDASDRRLWRNKKALALSRHKSQFALLRSTRIINADEVFWLRETDSISYTAEITSSDGDPSFLNDYSYYKVNEIDSIIPEFKNYMWIPHDNLKEAVFTWETPQTVSRVKVFGNYEEGSRIERIKINFDSGFSFEAGPLPERGKPLEVHFPTQRSIKRCVISILDSYGDQYGISEIEFYSTDIDQADSLQFLLTKDFKEEHFSVFDKEIDKIILSFIKIKKNKKKVALYIKKNGVLNTFKRAVVGK